MRFFRKEKILMVILSAAITAVIIRFISGSVFYTKYSLPIIFFTVAVAVITSGFIVSKMRSGKDS